MSNFDSVGCFLLGLLRGSIGSSLGISSSFLGLHNSVGSTGVLRIGSTQRHLRLGVRLVGLLLVNIGLDKSGIGSGSGHIRSIHSGSVSRLGLALSDLGAVEARLCSLQSDSGGSQLIIGRRLGGATIFLDGFSSSLAALGIAEGLLRGGQVLGSSLGGGVGIGHTHSLLREHRGFGDASLVQNVIRSDEGSSKLGRTTCDDGSTLGGNG